MESSGKDIEWETVENGAGGTWESGTNFIQFNIANDKECNGTASHSQSGTAILKFHNEIGKSIVISMEGRAESEYETFELFVDDKREVRVQASDGPTCKVHTCNMCDVEMKEQEITLAPGHHTIRVEIDTKDGKYHSNAFFRITFALKQKDVCKACECPKPGAYLVMRSLNNYQIIF